ncbi:MAG: DUF3786 domain-containing protein [Desulfatibacillaceae bacterium]|nr:DUF3786 domain-containing protein [Desulfatibacillaceae bacterium]
MARIDDYRQAKNLAVERLKELSVAELGKTAGYKADDNRLKIPFLNRVFWVGFPQGDFVDSDEPEKEIPLQEQVLILHYLTGVGRAKNSGRWVAYREIPGAGFYWDPFVKRAVNPFKNTFGDKPDLFAKTAGLLGGKKIDAGDSAFEFAMFPKIPLQIILHAGDDEFDAEASFLFDQSAGDILSPEDLAWLAGMLVYRLMALSVRV